MKKIAKKENVLCLAIVIIMIVVATIQETFSLKVELPGDVEKSERDLEYDPSSENCENNSNITYDNVNRQFVITGNKTDECSASFIENNYHEYCNDDTISCQIAKKYLESNSDVYYLSKDQTYTNSNRGSNDKSYRYSGVDYTLTNKSYRYDTMAQGNHRYRETGLIKVYSGSYSQSVGQSFDKVDPSDSYFTFLVLDYENPTGNRCGTYYTTYKDALQKAIADGYIAEKEIKNFVCFGYDDETKTYADGWCPEDNLYRIIGVFPETTYDSNGKIYQTGNKLTKLIKASYLKKMGLPEDESDNYYSEYFFSGYFPGVLNDEAFYAYDSSGKGAWATSDMKNNYLNNYYLNSLDTGSKAWPEMIKETVWLSIGGEIVPSAPLETYKQELLKNKDRLSDSEVSSKAKIGLLYLSDYAYANAPESWTPSYSLEGYFDFMGNYNWIYTGLPEWTMVPCIETSRITYNYYIRPNGSVDISGPAEPLAVRPTFYLKENVKLVGGNGSRLNPYRVG